MKGISYCREKERWDSKGWKKEDFPIIRRGTREWFGSFECLTKRVAGGRETESASKGFGSLYVQRKEKKGRIDKTGVFFFP